MSDAAPSTPPPAALPLLPVVISDVKVAELEPDDLANIGATGPHVQITLTVASPIVAGGLSVPYLRLAGALPAELAMQVGQGIVESAQDAIANRDGHPALDLPQTGLTPATPAQAARIVAEAERQAAERRC